MDYDVFDTGDTPATLVAAFEPTPRHVAIRERVRASATPYLLSKVEADSVDSLRAILPSYLIEEIRHTLRIHPEFLDWLTSEDEAQVQLQMAKSKAAKKLVDIMEIDSKDPKVLALQLKASETILNQTKRDRQGPRQTQNLRITAMPGIPKQMLNKTIDELSDELAQLGG